MSRLVKPATNLEMAQRYRNLWHESEKLRAAEREGRLRAEAQVRALEEALGEALEASREPRAEEALAEVRKDALEALTDFPAGDEHEWGNGVRAQAEDTLDILIRHGFGGGS